MRRAIALALVLACPGAVRAEAPAEGPASAAIVCDDLVALRRLMADAPDRDAARAHLAEHPSCHAVEPARLGEVERRAMIGGAPFECVRIAGSGCGWLLP